MKKGFTLIELIVVISIILLSGFGFANYVSYQNELQLSFASKHIVDVLKKARSNAVHVELPTGCSYDSYVGSGIVVNSSGTAFDVVIYCPGQQTIRSELMTQFPHVTFDSSSYNAILYFDKLYGKATGASVLCLKSTAVPTNNYTTIGVTDSWALVLHEHKSNCSP